jgi:hypothetical protein
MPMDGSDLDDLQRLANKDKQFEFPQIPYISSLNGQIRLLSDPSRDKYLSIEIERATNWRNLHRLYSRFKNCVSTLTAKISADGIPVPPRVTSFQEMMEKNWDIGNAQEAALSVHLSDFERVDYSHNVDKKELGIALQKFAREFMGDNGDDNGGVPNYNFASTGLCPTPVETMVRFK